MGLQMQELELLISKWHQVTIDYYHNRELK